MLVNFYNDPVDVTKVCADLNNGEIVVISTVRPNFKELKQSVKECVNIDPYSGEVEDIELSWHYYLAPGDEKYTSKQTDDFVVKAIKKWDAKGGHYPFSVYV